MTAPINLRRARKAKLRDKKAAEADARAAEFGVSLSAKRAARGEIAATQKQLDGHKLERK